MATTSASAGPCDAAPDLAGVRPGIWPRISPAGLATVWTLTYDRPASMAPLVVEKANHANGGIGRGCDELGGRCKACGAVVAGSAGEATAPHQQPDMSDHCCKDQGPHLEDACVGTDRCRAVHMARRESRREGARVQEGDVHAAASDRLSRRVDEEAGAGCSRRHAAGSSSGQASQASVSEDR